MRIGVPKEIKNHEYRVGLTPENVSELVRQGHVLYVETGAGHGIGAKDVAYMRAGAEILPTAEEIFAESEMIIKVKEPLAAERKMLRAGQILFTFLHLAPDPEQTDDLIKSEAICIAYETITNISGTLPLLKPMSQVAGRLSVQAGAYALQKQSSGAGVLLGGVPGVAPARVTIIGGGVVGENAMQMALGLGADVAILDKNLNVLERLSTQYRGQNLKTLYASKAALEETVEDADLVIGAVLIAGAAAPKLVTIPMIKSMRAGSVLVDVAIDQGGCFETSKPTTHSSPTYIMHDVVHYCVANMPGAVPRTSTYALNNATFPYIERLANQGYKKALQYDAHFMNGLNIYRGKVTCKSVATSLNHYFHEPLSLISGEI
ncbi:MAG: alanine dehydrogenase [Pseudomonadota bacterium]